MAKRRRRRRNPMRKNPDLTMLAVLGGVGIVGFIAYKHFSAPQVPIMPITSPTQTGWKDLLFGTASTLVTNKISADTEAARRAQAAKDINAANAAWSKSDEGKLALEAGKRYYLTKQGTEFVCIDKTTGKAVPRSVCDSIVTLARGTAGLSGLGGYEGGIFKKGTLG